MDTAITVAILGASVSVIGWVINYILTNSAEKHRQRLVSQLQFTEQQLEELYGPLVFLTVEGQHSFGEMLRVLRIEKHHVIESTKTLPLVKFDDEAGWDEPPSESKTIHIFGYKTSLSESQLNTWIFWVENEFFPRNQRIKDLISSKTHLIEGAEIPRSWLEFIDHCNSWELSHKLWEKELGQYPLRSEIDWPEGFNRDVISTFQGLKNRHTQLMGLIHSKNRNPKPAP